VGAPSGQISFATNEMGSNPFNFAVSGTVAARLARFDFGTAASPLQPGYTRVAAGTTYAAAKGYGWQSGKIGERDRATGSSLRKDLVFTALGVFAVDLPNGAYLAALTMGDSGGAHDQMGVSLEGTQFDSVTTASGEFTVRTYPAFVADGQLNLQLADLGGKDANAVINALELIPVASRRFDFGTASSPLAPGFARVCPATGYSSTLGYGWVSGTIDCRDRASGSTLARDLNFTALGTFAVDVPNGAYDVVVTTGDWSGAHDQMGIFVEGTKVDTITTAAREVLARVYPSTVSDGKLTVLLDDLGGSDPNVVLNGLEVVPAGAGRFDFGTDASPVEAGYTRVAAGTAYSPWQGFGWLLGTRDSRDRARGSALTRDLAFSPFAVFAVDLLPGTWDLAVTMGDASALHDMMAFAVDGNRLDTFGTPANQFHAQTYRAILRGDPVTVAIEDLGGSDPNAVINGLSLARVGAFKGDFGTASSPVEAAYTRVTHATTYSALRGHGWLSGTINSRDRATGTALRRDINFTVLGMFVVDMPNGTYDVTITLGDAAAAHDEMGIWLEAARVDTVTTAKGQFSAKTYRVAVTDGQLTVLLDDLGGVDASVAIAAIEVR
jgi:fibronectin type 3 domain-containing protein